MNSKQLPLVRALPSNQQGRDFVVGDLHGCFDLLDRLLETVRFDPVCDRLFSVGDLVDRGPDSLRSLEFLEAPWFFAVKGNHETMLLECFEAYLASGRMDYWKEVVRNDVWINGGEWVKACHQPEDQRMTGEFDLLLQRLRDLPLVWVVGEGADRFQVIHAELVRPGYQNQCRKVWLDTDIDRWRAGASINDETQERLVWGRTLMLMLADPGTPPMQKGLSTTFCGHTIADSVRSYLSHVCLDTGAYLSQKIDSREDSNYGLTLHSVQEQRQLRTSYSSAEVIEICCSTVADGVKTLVSA